MVLPRVVRSNRLGVAVAPILCARGLRYREGVGGLEERVYCVSCVCACLDLLRVACTCYHSPCEWQRHLRLWLAVQAYLAWREDLRARPSNNMYIFPGLGLGMLLVKASRVTDSMVDQASVALAGRLDEDERTAGLVYPRLDRIRDISVKVAPAVVRAAQNSVLPNLELGIHGELQRTLVTSSNSPLTAHWGSVM
jgi:Malic enzyme, NAD binding domain